MFVTIVVCYGWMDPDGLPSLILEYMTYGSLDKILENNHPSYLQNNRLPKLSKVSSLHHKDVRRAFLTIFNSFQIQKFTTSTTHNNLLCLISDVMMS